MGGSNVDGVLGVFKGLIMAIEAILRVFEEVLMIVEGVITGL